MKIKKKLLVVSYFFPPYGEVGAMRIAKFVKYLLRFGWDITVVTVKEKYYKNFNYDWLKEVEKAEIIRIDRIEYKVPGINEEGLYWIPHLYETLKSLLKKELFKISLWTGGPFYHWVLAPFFKKKYNLKYILDFRDPWRLNPYKKKKSIFSYGAKILEYIIEPRVIKDAEYIINVTDEATDLYKEFYKKTPSEKFVTIYNGYDPEDFEGIRPIKFSKFDIVYTGKFGNFRDPEPFLRAFRSVIIQQNLTPNDIRFIWIGNREQHVVKTIYELNIEQFVEMVGFKPYKEALRYVKGADICLLITGNHQFEPTTKIFDYIGMNKFILCISDSKGFVYKLLSKYENKLIVRNNSGNIKRALNSILYDNNKDSKALSLIFDRTVIAKILERYLLCIR